MMSFKPSTGIATEARVSINPIPDLVQLSACSIAFEFTDDVSLLNAVPCWSDAELIQQWDLEWERYQGDPEWLRRGEFGELPEELIDRPASAYRAPDVKMPVLNATPTNIMPHSLQEITTHHPAVDAPPEHSPSDHDHLEMMDALGQLKLINSRYHLANVAAAEVEATRHRHHTELVHRRLDTIIDLLWMAHDAKHPQ